MAIYVTGDTLTVASGSSNFGMVFSGNAKLRYTKGTNVGEVTINDSVRTFPFDDGSTIEVLDGWVDMSQLSSGVPRNRGQEVPDGTIYPGNERSVTTSSGDTAIAGYGKCRLIIEDTSDNTVVFNKIINLSTCNYPFNMNPLHTNHRATYQVMQDALLVYGT